MAKPKDFSGKRFGRLVAVSRGAKKNDTYYWNCLCECGNEATVYLPSLTSGATKSCGCLQREVASETLANTKTTHGHAKRGGASGEYYVWHNMLRRCNDERHVYYKSYGGRGIKVCDEWASFSNFIKDMGARPPGMSLDRIDNEQGYSKENCRWATKTLQARNTRANRLIEFNGEIKTCAEWSEITGLSRTTIALRIDRYGWDVSEALGYADRKRKR